MYLWISWLFIQFSCLTLFTSSILFYHIFLLWCASDRICVINMFLVAIKVNWVCILYSKCFCHSRNGRRRIEHLFILYIQLHLNLHRTLGHCKVISRGWNVCLSKSQWNAMKNVVLISMWSLSFELNLPMLRLLSSKAQRRKIFEIYQNSVMLVFIG